MTNLAPRTAVALLLLVAGFNLFLRLDALPYHGEESRRVLIGREMLETGDWLVPHQQGVPRLTKPPLHYWLMGGLVWLSGGVEPWVMRLPSAVATLLTALLLYWYAGGFLSRLGAFAASFTYLTLGEIARSGSDAEMEGIFTLFVAGSLFVWHGGRLRGWSPYLYWGAAYAFVALGTLTKGVQGPVYFGAGVGLYLIVTGRWRDLFHPAHFVGLALFAAAFGAWLVPYALTMGPKATWTVFMGEAVTRTLTSVLPFLRHLVVFPLAFFGSLLPWSPLLLAFADGPTRRALFAARPEARFAALCFLIAFPTCWLPSGGETRYLRPMIPCLGVLFGLIVQQVAEDERLRAGWRLFLGAWAVTATGAAVALTVATWAGYDDWQQPGPIAAAFVAVAGLVAIGLFHHGERDAAAAVVLIGALSSFAVTGVMVNRAARKQTDVAGDVAAVRRALPAGARVVSFGQVHHHFLLAYNGAIGCRAWPRPRADAGEIEYFCFDVHRGHRLKPPFPFEEVAVVSVDRQKRAVPDVAVVVGRRVKPEVSRR